jgi:hypothetical protein
LPGIICWAAQAPTHEEFVFDIVFGWNDVRCRAGTTEICISADRQGAGMGMAKIRISSSDLVWIFTEKLRSFDECSQGTNIAIVPSEDGWTAIMGARRRGPHPRCDRRIEQIQKQLRQIYVLAKD